MAIVTKKKKKVVAEEAPAKKLKKKVKAEPEVTKKKAKTAKPEKKAKKAAYTPKSKATTDLDKKALSLISKYDGAMAKIEELKEETKETLLALMEHLGNSSFVHPETEDKKTIFTRDSAEGQLVWLRDSPKGKPRGK